MKNSIKVFLFVFLCFLFVLMSNVNAYASEEIYFDEEGNLIYITYDKKATSSVSYKAIGWILKRYDAPINAKGQQYVIVRKIEYAVDDPDNPGYLYCYFWSDKDEILDAVEKVSSEWRRQLEEYGDMVYIDNVMTVCNSRVPLGNVDENGKCTGEVYYTYAGISGARSWAKPEYLKSYFDIKLTFPILIKKPEISVVDSKEDKKKLVSGNMLSMNVGSNEKNNDEYSVSEGIPSGEKLYFDGSCDSYYYEVDYSKWTYTLNIPVKVSTKYTIKWVDYNGENMSETRTIDRWYLVPKNVTYNVINGVNIYNLSKVLVKSGLLTKDTELDIVSHKQEHVVSKRVYGTYIYHLKKTEYVCTTSNVVLTSDNYIKPSIPNSNNYSVASKAVSNIEVRSDYLSVDGKEISSDTYKSNTGSDLKKVQPELVSLYKAFVYTNKLAKNGEYDDFVMSCVYKTGSLVHKVENSNINSVMVHTPVVIKMSIYGDKTVNQAETPSFSDVVPDSDFYVQFDYFGKHNDIQGYGLRDYSKYVGKRFVKFPFVVNYKNKEYKANTWIEMAESSKSFNIPATTKIGTYNVECKVVAYNGDEKSSLAEGFNRDVSQYGAYYVSRMDVIGRIYDVEINEETTYRVGDKDYNGKLLTDTGGNILPMEYDVNEGGKVSISFTTLGELKKDAYTDISVKFYHTAGQASPVEVDVICEQDYTQSLSIGMQEIIRTGVNTYLWKFSYTLPVNYAVADKNTGQILHGGVTFIVFDMKLNNPSYKTLSYINTKNYSKGYCNMWRLQGGKENVEISGVFVNILDGALLYAGLGETTKYDYEINGTH